MNNKEIHPIFHTLLVTYFGMWIVNVLVIFSSSIGNFILSWIFFNPELKTQLEINLISKEVFSFCLELTKIQSYPIIFTVIALTLEPEKIKLLIDLIKSSKNSILDNLKPSRVKK